MKKVIGIFSALLIICSMAYGVEMDSKEFLAYSVVNTTGSPTLTFVPTTSIYPSDRILGYEVSNYSDNVNGNHEVYCTVYDSDGAAIEVTDEQIGESESISGDSLCNWFPYPRNLSYGIGVIQGSQTVVTIYFER